jgi:hypothetical protein
MRIEEKGLFVYINDREFGAMEIQDIDKTDDEDGPFILIS